MNCQHVSRLMDRGFHQLSDTERREAAAHALSCRQCAATWGVQSQLAALRIPPVPRDLTSRCRVLAVMTAEANRRHAWRRFTLISGVVALAAAAAAALVVSQGSWTPVQRHAADVTSTTTPANPLQTAGVAASQAAGDAQTAIPRYRDLPLLPRPVFLNRASRSKLALKTIAARHPELVHGPEVDGAFVAALTMRSNGEVLNSIVRIAAPGTIREAIAEVDRTLPMDADGISTEILKKEKPLPDGSTLRADLTLRVGNVPNGYDMGRSNLRVLEIARERFARLMLPPADGKLNRLTLLLAEDGTILRQDTELVLPQDPVSINERDPDDVARFADRIAGRLRLDAGQLGLVGTTTLEEGSLNAVFDEAGNGRREDTRRQLLVNYAWLRQGGAAGPVFGQVGASRSPVDTAIALQIAERVIPDAFTFNADPDAGGPTVVLTGKGAFIRAGYLRGTGGRTTPQILQKQIQEQIAPGVETSLVATLALVNQAGMRAMVTFAWEPD